MGSTIYPRPTGAVSSVKSVQRGTAASAGNITISSVDMSKTVCHSFPTGATGTASPSGTVPVATVTGTGGLTETFGYATSTAPKITGITSGNFVPGYSSGGQFYYVGQYYTNNVNGGQRSYYGGRYGNTLQTQYINARQVVQATVTSYNFHQPAYVNATNISYSTAVNAAPTQTITKPSQTVTGGTTNIVAKEYGVYLSNSTTIVATGPCRYEVVEYY
jgi:hypothetical protein